MSNEKFISICIPSYNRPEELLRLLNSIDIEQDQEVEIVICEDFAPKREEVRKIVDSFKEKTLYQVKYIENRTNLGYDRNLRQCISCAVGKWIMFMGDDDVFVAGKMDDYILFLKQHDELGYVMRSYQAIHYDGSMEQFKYFENTRFFEAGYEAYVTLFRKSVFISGFAFRREYALESMSEQFDGTLLYQLYILAEICLNYPSAYYGDPITQSIDGGVPYFGNSETEKQLYTPGTITVDNSVNFIKNYFVITEFVDKKYSVNSTEYVKKDLSKYAYPILSIQRKKGRRVFREYHMRLKNIGIACTAYYYIYYWGLFVFNEKFCDSVIRGIKKFLGRTPRL